MPDFIVEKKMAFGAWAPSRVISRAAHPVSRKGHLAFPVSKSSLTEHVQVTSRIHSRAALYKQANPLQSILR